MTTWTEGASHMAVLNNARAALEWSRMIILTPVASEAGVSVANILACLVIHPGCEASPPMGVEFSASRFRSRNAVPPFLNTQGGSRAMLLFEVLTRQATASSRRWVPVSMLRHGNKSSSTHGTTTPGARDKSLIAAQSYELLSSVGKRIRWMIRLRNRRCFHVNMETSHERIIDTSQQVTMETS